MKHRIGLIVVAVVVGLFLAGGIVLAVTSDSETYRLSRVASVTTSTEPLTSTTYVLTGTFGQVLSETVSSANYVMPRLLFSGVSTVRVSGSSGQVYLPVVLK